MEPENGRFQLAGFQLQKNGFACASLIELTYIVNET